jgi:hypothetical protein
MFDGCGRGLVVGAGANANDGATRLVDKNNAYNAAANPNPFVLKGNEFISAPLVFRLKSLR